ncbi:MAG: hypothetical protein V4463_13685 [Pseudomonadota bacterium]
MSPFRTSFASFALLLLSACGGGGGTTAPAAQTPSGIVPPLTPADPSKGAGVFDVNYGQFRGVYTFLDNGQFYGLHFVSGNTLAGQPHGFLTSSNSLSNLEAIAWANFIDDVKMVGSQESAGRFGHSFGGSGVNVAIKGSMGSFTAAASVQKTQASVSSKTLYNDPIPLATLAGTYGGVMRTVGLDRVQEAVVGFTLSASGAFSVSNAGCDFSGKLSPHGSTGIFDVDVKVGGVACQLKNTLKGIVTPLGISAAATSLALQLDTADDAQSAVFILSR